MSFNACAQFLGHSSRFDHHLLTTIRTTVLNAVIKLKFRHLPSNATASLTSARIATARAARHSLRVASRAMQSTCWQSAASLIRCTFPKDTDALTRTENEKTCKDRCLCYSVRTVSCLPWPWSSRRPPACPARTWQWQPWDLVRRNSWGYWILFPCFSCCWYSNKILLMHAVQAASTTTYISAMASFTFPPQYVLIDSSHNCFMRK